MAQDNVSAASMLSDEVVRAAQYTLGEVSKFPEYATLDDTEARKVLADAIATGTLLRTSGDAVVTFPNKWPLRMIATAEPTRGFAHASNTRLVRAAAAKLHISMMADSDSGDSGDSGDEKAAKSPKEKSSRSQSTNGQKKIYIEVRESMDEMIEDATMQVVLFCQRRASDAAKAREEKVVEVVKGMSDAEKLAMVAQIMATMQPKEVEAATE